MFFSVIICVYNTQATYLRQCIESVLGQNYPNFETIVVNDGSVNEDTLSTLSAFKKTGGIQLIEQTNSGQAAARNTGIKNASGDYLLFIDSDDYYLSSNVLTDIAKLLDESHADICTFQYVEFFSDNECPVYAEGDLPRDAVFGKSREEALKVLLKQAPKVFSSVTHTKVIKAELIRQHNIQMPVGVKNEDIYFTAKLIQYAKTYDRYNKVAHAYRRSNEMSLTTHKKNFRSIERSIVDMFCILFEKENIAQDYYVLDFLSAPYAYWMGKTVSALVHSDDKEERRLIMCDIKEMKKYAFVLRCSSRGYVRLIGIINSFFGMRVALFALRVYLTINRKHMLSINRKMS